MPEYDFSGWVTKNDLRCSDGRTIRHGAFKECDGQTVPLVWNHQYNSPSNVLGNVLLKNRDEGVYGYGRFNDTTDGKNAKLLVQHGDITRLSIYANQLRQNGGDVLHGMIREVSLVHAAANPGAFIDSVIRHGAEMEGEIILSTGDALELFHSDEQKEEVKEEMVKEEPKKEPDAIEHADKELTDVDVLEFYAGLNDDDKKKVDAFIGMVVEQMEENSKDNKGGNENVKHNLFDNDEQQAKVNEISHSEMMAVIKDAPRYGSMKESALQHGITNIDYLFPEDKNLNVPPAFIQRDTGWVSEFFNAAHHTPFSRIKSTFADITGEQARALGYFNKGNQKKEEVIALLKRSTDPTTVYKLLKMDRDDVIDITDFDVVAWIKKEMRMMLDEEIARASLIGDGRTPETDDKIDETKIRPIWTDADTYTIKGTISVAANATDDDKAVAFIRTAIKQRKNYQGSGNPILFTTEDELANMLLLTDGVGRDLYDDETKLAKKLRVRKIVTVPVMANKTRTVSGVTRTLAGIIVNPQDYNYGADKGGSVNMFDDFDLNYNKHEYLIETRCSGALIKPYSAIALEYVTET